MRVRRAAVTGAVAALVLLGGSSWADETPGPDPAGNGDCFVVPDATDEPTAEVTDEPTSEPTSEPTAEVTDEPTPEVTEEPAPEVTEEPTPDVTEEPTPDATPGTHVVCLAYTDGTPESGPTLGGGSAQLPFSGAPVGRYAVTGLALVLAGAGSVLLARRRST